jgi:hypothetical protein
MMIRRTSVYTRIVILYQDPGIKELIADARKGITSMYAVIERSSFSPCVRISNQILPGYSPERSY